MAIVEYIGIVAKCKHCTYLRRTYEGRRVVHKCARLGILSNTNPKGWSITLQRVACDTFKLFGT